MVENVRFYALKLTIAFTEAPSDSTGTSGVVNRWSKKSLTFDGNRSEIDGLRTDRSSSGLHGIERSQECFKIGFGLFANDSESILLVFLPKY